MGVIYSLATLNHAVAADPLLKTAEALKVERK